MAINTHSTQTGTNERNSPYAPLGSLPPPTSQPSHKVSLGYREARNKWAKRKELSWVVISIRQSLTFPFSDEKSEAQD